MKNESKIKAMVESAVLCAVVVVIVLLTMYMPMFYIVGFIVLPIPFAYIQIKYGIKYSVMSLVVAAVISTALIGDPFSAISIVALYGVIGVTLGYSSKAKFEPLVTIMLMTALTCICTLIIYKIDVSVLQFDPVKQIVSAVNEATNSVKNAYTGMGIKDESINQLLSGNNIGTLVKMLLPSCLIISSVVSSFIIYKLAYKIFKRINCGIQNTKPMSMWFLSRGLTTAMLIMIVASLVGFYELGDNGYIYLVSSFLIFVFAYLMQAVGVVSYFCDKAHMPRIMKYIIIIFSMMIVPFNYLLVFLGMIDYIVDFRKIGPRNVR